MKTGTIIAFPEKSLQGEGLAGLKTTRLRVGGEICLGVQMDDLARVCEILGLSESGISKIQTDYQGVYLARFSGNGHVGSEEKSKANRHDTLRRKYMELCGYNRKAKRVRGLKKETEKLLSGIKKCQEQLVGFIRQLEEKERQLQAVAGTDETSLVRFGDEFEQLMKHPDIEGLEIVGEKIIVYTGRIFISHHGVDYDIGKFKIAINTLGKDNMVRMMNLTSTTGDDEGRTLHHPHIREYGIPCLGNIQEVLPHMIAEHKYAAAISVCIQYLKSYENSDLYHPYGEIQNWPVAKNHKRNNTK